MPEPASVCTNPWMRKACSQERKDRKRSHPKDCSHSSHHLRKDLSKDPRKGRAHGRANCACRQSGARRYSSAHDTSIVAVCGTPVVSTRDTRSTRRGRRVADARLGAPDRKRDAALSGPAEGEQCRARERRGRNCKFSNTRLFHIYSPLQTAP
jgi:hypothetical protein